MANYQQNYDPFSSSFSMLKLRYASFDEEIAKRNFLCNKDKVNIFINLESVYTNISTIDHLEEKILVQKDFNTLIVSYIINLAAHYKRFFNGMLDVKIYLYGTNLMSDEFNEYKYNSDFRSYYLLKYNENPKFLNFSERLKFEILPEVTTICEFIPRIYVINTKNIDGGIVPYVIASQDPSRKNFVIGCEQFETQYSLFNNFMNIRFLRYSSTRYLAEADDFVNSFLNNNKDVGSLKIFKHYGIYCGLLSVLGDKPRSIDGVYGLGPKSYERMIYKGIANNLITEDTLSGEVLSSIFLDGDSDEFLNGYYCSNILSMYDLLTEAQKKSILDQIIDRTDINALNNLNATKYYTHPLMLEGLLL